MMELISLVACSELAIDISVINILGANTISQIVEEVCEKLLAKGKH